MHNYPSLKIYNTLCLLFILHLNPLSAQAPYGVKELSPEACESSMFFRAIAQRLPNNILIREDSIILWVHDRDQFLEAFQASNDGIAIDIVNRKQLLCDAPFDLNPSTIFDGEMFPPVTVPEILKRNQKAETFKIYSYLGSIPPELLGEQIDLNVISIKNGYACEYSFPVETPFDQLPLFQINPIWAFAEIEEKVDLSRINLSPKQLESQQQQFETKTAQFKVPFQKGKDFLAPSDINQIISFVQENIAYIDQVEIKAYSSIEGNEAINLRLQKGRAERIKGALLREGIASSLIKTEAIENWPLFYEQIENTKWRDLAEKSKEDVKLYVIGEVEKELEPLLAEQRIADIQIQFREPVETPFFEPYKEATTSESSQSLINKLEKFVELSDANNSLLIQYDLIKSFLDLEVNLYDLLDLKIPIEKKYLPVLSNMLAVELFFNESIRTDPAYIQRLKKIQSLDPDYYPMRFNLAGYAVRYMFQTEKAFIKPGELMRLIFDLYDNESYKIEYQDLDITLNRLMTNFHLAAVDYFFEKRVYEARRNSLKEIRNFFFEADMNEKEAIDLAKYFNRNYYTEWTLDVLLPYYETGSYSEDLLFVLAQTSVHLEDVVTEEQQKTWFEQCRQRNQERFCRYISRNFQLLRTDWIKELACSNCSDF